MSVAKMLNAYGISSSIGDGTGQTIAIVGAYDNSYLVPTTSGSYSTSDLGVFESTESVTHVTNFFSKVNQTGGSTYTSNPGGIEASWLSEEAMDVEWTHAVAPGAKIVLVEANADDPTDLMAAVQTAAGISGVSVVSMSFGFAEGTTVSGTTINSSFENTYDSSTSVFKHSNVAFVAAAGDSGAGTSALYPAASPEVLSVGGTTISITGTGPFAYSNEVAWTNTGVINTPTGYAATGGSASIYESRPTYQNGFNPSSNRTTPDIAFDGDPLTGAWVYDVATGTSSGNWSVIGGTSLGAPSWAGILAITQQKLAAASKPLLNYSNLQASIYALPSADFHDINFGNNFTTWGTSPVGNSAGFGYDLVTGRGTPYANLVVHDLVNTTVTISVTGNLADPTHANIAVTIGTVPSSSPGGVTGNVNVTSGGNYLAFNTPLSGGSLILPSVPINSSYLTTPLVAVTYAGTSSYSGINTSGTAYFYVPASAFSNANWVDQIYKDTMGRHVDQPGLNTWVGQLTSGTPASTVAYNIESNAEPLNDLIEAYYLTYLVRDASSTEKSSWASQLTASSGAINQWGFRNDILQSTEFHNHYSSDTSYVTSVYQIFLGRNPTSGELSSWINGSGFLNTSLSSFVSSMDTGTALDNQTTDMFEQFLRTAPLSAQLSSWRSNYSAGWGQPFLLSVFLSSGQYTYQIQN